MNIKAPLSNGDCPTLHWLFRRTLALHGRCGNTHCPSTLHRIVAFLLPGPKCILQGTGSLICSVGGAHTCVRVPLNRGPAGDLSGFTALPPLFFFSSTPDATSRTWPVFVSKSRNQALERLPSRWTMCQHYTMNGLVLSSSFINPKDFQNVVSFPLFHPDGILSPMFGFPLGGPSGFKIQVIS